MVSPRTFRGYDQEGNQVASCSAKDATEYLNPNEVKVAVDNLIAVFQQEMNNIATALRDTIKDANEAVIVRGTKMSGTIEDTADSIQKIPSQVIGSFQDLYSAAVSTCDTLQEELNTAAYNSVAACSGVYQIVG